MNAQDRIQELVDRVDIIETMHEYCRLADILDGVGMAALFTPDCVADYAPASGTLKLNGLAEVTNMLTTALAPVISGSHHIANEQIRFPTPDTANFFCYMYSW